MANGFQTFTSSSYLKFALTLIDGIIDNIMELFSNRTPEEPDWYALESAISDVHSLADTEEFDTLLRENRLRETTVISPPGYSQGVCVQESIFANSNLTGLFGGQNITFHDFALTVDSFGHELPIIYGRFIGNGVPYRLSQVSEILLLQEEENLEMPGFNVEYRDLKHLLYAQIASLCDEEPDAIESILAYLSPDASPSDSIHDLALAFGSVIGSSASVISASFNCPDRTNALIAYATKTETSLQSEQSVQLDVGLQLQTQVFEAGELHTYARAVPDDSTFDESAHSGLITETTLPPVDFVDHIRLHGKISGIDALTASRLHYPALTSEEGVEYAKLCQKFAAIITPRLEEIASR